MKVKFSGEMDIEIQDEPTPVEPVRIIFRSRNKGQAVGTGALDTLRNIADGLWTEDQVGARKLQICQFLQRAMIADEPSVLDAIDELSLQFPHVLNLSLIRWDLMWFGRDEPHTHPDRSWGSPNFPFPSRQSHAGPAHGHTWQRALAMLSDAGYTQNAHNAANTDPNAELPYRIELHAQRREWLIRETQMDITSISWQKRCAKSVVKWIKMLPNVHGVCIGPVKYQWSQPNTVPMIRRFAAWLHDNANPGWSVATNSGGTIQPSWGVQYYSSGWSGQTLFDTPSYTIEQNIIASASFAMEVKKRFSEDCPEKVVVYDPFSGGVPWTASIQRAVRDNMAAGQFERIQRALKQTVDYFMFPTEAINASEALQADALLNEETRNYLRGDDGAVWCHYPPRNQRDLSVV